MADTAQRNAEKESKLAAYKISLYVMDMMRAGLSWTQSKLPDFIVETEEDFKTNRLSIKMTVEVDESQALELLEKFRALSRNSRFH